MVNDTEQLENLRTKTENLSALKFTHELSISNKLSVLDIHVDANPVKFNTLAIQNQQMQANV